MNAKENFCSGFNCAQAVGLAFAEELGMSEKAIAKMLSGFGGGVARLREVCGAISGMVFVFDMLYGYDDPENDEIKAVHYAKIRDLVAKFNNEVGAIRCQDIMKNAEIGGDPAPRTHEYYRTRVCPELCALSEKLLREYIESHPIEE